MSESGGFDPEATKQFIDNYYNSVRGHVRREVVRNILSNYLYDNRDPSGLKVLDYQGGDGSDALWLAEMGCDVVMLDKSDDMYVLANANWIAADHEVKDRVDIRHGGFEELYDDQTFDLVISHGVLPYILDRNDAQYELNRLGARVKDGGLMALLTNGYAAKRAKLDELAQRAFDKSGGVYTNGVNKRVRGYRPEDIGQMIVAAGFDDPKMYGVRIFSDADKRPIKDVSKDELREIFAKETTASIMKSMLDSAQMVQCIAKKPKPTEPAKRHLELVPSLQ